MNRLDPNLKKLIAWSRQAAPPPVPVPPPGFAVDVVLRANARIRVRESIPDSVLTFVSWASAAVVLAALAFFLAQPATSELAPYMGPAAQFLASNFAP